MIKRSSIFLVMHLLGACSGSSGKDGGPSEGGLPGDLPASRPATVQQINTEDVLAGEWVRLTGVTVTAVDHYGKNTKDVFVQQGTGAYSGLRIYGPTRVDGGSLDALKPGDQLEVTGKVKHYAPEGGFNDQKHPKKTYIRELVEARITLAGSGAPPASAELTVGQLVEDPDAETWEHVLVRLKDALVVKGINAHGEFEVEGELRIDDELAPAHTPEVGDCLSITGISSYYYGYKLLPRQAADIQTASGCVSNPTHAIQDLQDTSRPTHPAPGTKVVVEGVISAVDSSLDALGSYEGFYLQDPAGGPHSGIFIYHKWTPASAEKPVLGQRVQLGGTYAEYGAGSGTLSELTFVTWTVKGTAKVPAPAVLSAAEITAGGATAEAYEGVLVQVNTVQVGGYKADSKGVQIGFFDAGSGMLVIHKLYDFMAAPPPVGTTFSKVIGPLHFVAGTFEVMPRSGADLVP